MVNAGQWQVMIVLVIVRDYNIGASWWFMVAKGQ